jgi:predicted membrane-bound mannosyltransferase
MKTKLAAQQVLACAIIVAFITPSCTQSQFNDAAITAAVTVATTTGLKMAVQDPSRRTVIADYLEVYSTALRSVTGNPTPEQLTTLINQFIPQNVKDQYPELVTFAIPLIVGAYKQAYDRWGSAQAVTYLNDIAAGIEAGAGPFATHK